MEDQSEISALTRENEQLRQDRGRGGGGRGGGGDDFDPRRLAELDEELERVRNELEDKTAALQSIENELNEVKAERKKLKDEKAQNQRDIEKYKREAQTMQDKLMEADKDRKAAELKKKESNKETSDYFKENRKLSDEKRIVDEENANLKAQLQKLQNHCNEIEAVLVHTADEKDHLEIDLETARRDIEGLKGSIETLQQGTDEVHLNLQKMLEEKRLFDNKVEVMKAEHVKEMTKATQDLKASKDKISTLEKQILELKNSTLVGEKQKQIDALQIRELESNNLIDSLRIELENTLADKQSLIERIMSDDFKIDQRVAEKTLAVKERTKTLEKLLQDMKRSHEEEVERFASLEKERDACVREVDELKKWRDVYERGLGIQVIAKEQRKLLEDKRRLSVVIDQVKVQLDTQRDATNTWYQAFTRLKTETGKDPNFMYSEYDLQEDMYSDNARLVASVSQLEEQVSALEKENSDLRKTMRKNAGSIGEQGFKYAGMSPDMLVKVNEFAASLRDGKLELPINDRSRELLEENKKLREKNQSLQLLVERFEREVGGVSSSGPAGFSKAQESEILGIRGDMQRLMNENAELHDRIAAMQGEVMMLLRQHLCNEAGKNGGGGGAGGSDEIAQMLVRNNEILMQELQDLKRTQGSMHGQYMQQRLYQQQVAQPTPDDKASAIKAAPSTSKKASSQSTAVVPAGSGDANTAANTAAPTPKKEVTANQVLSTPMGGGHAPMMSPRVGQGYAGAWSPMMVPMYGNFAPPMQMMPMPMQGPATPHGRQLLARNLSELNLPPEEWTHDVRDLNGQLIECLEQLYEREEELREQKSTVAAMEDDMIAMKQQMACLYYDFAQRADAWDTREVQYKQHINSLVEERENYKIKVSRYDDMLNHLKKEDKDSNERKLMELNRKVTIHEVNESMLSRKFTALSEQLEHEQEMRKNLEKDFVDMEASLKKRILFLEQYKAAVSSRLGHLQGKLDTSIPQEDFFALQSELENLREDHLTTLRREVEARVAALKSRDQARELRALKVSVSHMQGEVAGTRAQIQALHMELEHEKETTRRVAAAATSSVELSTVVSEMAKFRGESSRLEVELAVSNRKTELLVEQVQGLLRDVDSLEHRAFELQQREELATQNEEKARKALLDMSIKYEGGLTKEQADELRGKHEKCTKDLEATHAEMLRHREMAEIASLQAKTIRSFREQHEEELNTLREHCVKLESRGDDDILIGRLQRQLMSTKTSYKAFVRKHENLRAEMRRRELAQRALETRRDQLEQGLVDEKEKHQMDVAVLKRALRNLSNIIDPSIEAPSSSPRSPDKSLSKKTPKTTSGLNAKAASIGLPVENIVEHNTGLVTIGHKLMSLSNKVNQLSTMAEGAVVKATEAEEEARNLEGIVQDLRLEKENLLARCQDLEGLSKGNNKLITARLISLSEEVRTNKLSNLQQKRQIQILRQEKRHLQNIISSIEADVEGLEEGKVLAETKNLLGDIDDDDGADNKKANNNNKTHLESTTEVKRNHQYLLSLSDPPTKTTSAPASNKNGVQFDSLDINDDLTSKLPSSKNIVIELDKTFRDSIESKEPSAPEEMIEKMRSLTEQLSQNKRELSASKARVENLQSQVMELQTHLQERDSQIVHLERSLAKDGKLANSNSQLKRMTEDQEKIQEAAQVKISSLLSLLDERNRTIEKLQHKLEDLKEVRPAKSNADKKAEDLLLALNNENEKKMGNIPPGNFKSAGMTLEEFENATAMQQRLLDQIKQADEILFDKDRLIQQLEQKLAVQNNQRERAEIRCGTSIKEMEAMKADMITLAKQLQASEERCNQLARSTSKGVAGTGVPDGQEEKIVKLQRTVKAKDEKIKGYREIIIRLKEEFIKSEEERAMSSVNNAASSKAADAASGGPTISADEMRELRSQITALREGLKHAKEDLEKARKTREKLSQARQASQEEVERLENQIGIVEAQATAAQDALQRVRKELEESRRKEARLREKLKDMMEGESKVNETSKDPKKSDNKAIEQLRREVELLQAQNAALRTAASSSSFTASNNNKQRPNPNSNEDEEEGKRDSSPGRNRLGNKAEDTFTSSKGHTLGGGDEPPKMLGGGADDLRALQHAKWEAEKKMSKRVATLEKRLQEKMEENEELHQQLKRARENVQSAVSAKDDLQKKTATLMKQSNDVKKTAAGDTDGLEKANAKIFALEEKVAELRRKAEVEMVAEIASLRHNLSVSRTREEELRTELEESEALRKKAASSTAGGMGGGRTLRDSEDKFMREERLKEDLARARQQRLELEATLLDRDARAMESRFDLEAREQEIERLKRRNKELEQAYRNLSANIGSNPLGGGVRSAWTEDSTSGGGGSKNNREKDLEGVVEAMKRVVDKLKGENDRLRKGGEPKNARSVTRKSVRLRRRREQRSWRKTLRSFRAS